MIARPMLLIAYTIGAFFLIGLVLSIAAVGVLYRRFGWPEEDQKRSNCFAAVLPLFLRDGGYLVVRMSHHAKLIPHLMHATSMKSVPLTAYSPLNPYRDWRSFLHAFWYLGRMKTTLGDR